MKNVHKFKKDFLVLRFVNSKNVDELKNCSWIQKCLQNLKNVCEYKIVHKIEKMIAQLENAPESENYLWFKK